MEGDAAGCVGEIDGAWMSRKQQPIKLAWMRPVLERYEGPLLRYAARITEDVELARDVVQETFLKLCSQQQARLNGRVAPWLFAVCRSRAVDLKRKAARSRALTDAEVPKRDTSGGDPSTVAERREGTSRALQMIALLPANQQEVIRLRFQEGLSYKEIAEVTRLSLGNVGYLIHTAIHAIRERLRVCDESVPKA